MLRRSKTDKGKDSALPVEGAHILLVSDDPYAAELHTRLLDHVGFEVSGASGIDEATGTGLNAEQPVSLALVDFRSGGTSLGLKLVDMLRENSEDAVADMRVIITTDLAENRLFSWQSGVDGFLVRPYHAKTLVDEIAAVLGRTDQERAAHRRERVQQVAASA